MPIDSPNNHHAVAAIVADVIGSRRLPDQDHLAASLAQAAMQLNEVFASALAAPFAFAAGDEIRGVLADPSQAPLTISLLRERLAPMQVRVGVGIGSAEGLAQGSTDDPFALALTALATAKREGGVLRYLGAGAPNDILLNAVCRLIDELILERSPKQWDAIAAYRRLHNQRVVAKELGVTRQSVGDRLSAGHRRKVEDADVAIAAYLTYFERP